MFSIIFSCHLIDDFFCISSSACKIIRINKEYTYDVLWAKMFSSYTHTHTLSSHLHKGITRCDNFMAYHIYSLFINCMIWLFFFFLNPYEFNIKIIIYCLHVAQYISRYSKATHRLVQCLVYCFVKPILF